MNFINQFPYLDAHELNLDWVINAVKTLSSHVDYLQEEFNKITVMTEAQIDAKISDAIAENNVEVYTTMNNMKNQITQEYQAYINTRINDLRTYIDNIESELRVYIDAQDSYYNGLSIGYASNALTESKEYTDSKVLSVTMMINPITGDYDDVRDVITDIIDYFHSDNTLTAAEYDALSLTAQAYDNYQITAFDYDFNGKDILT